MNYFNKVVAIVSLVSFIGTVSAEDVKQTRMQMLNNRMKNLSRNVRTFMKCARTEQGCPPEVKAQLMADAKDIAKIVVVTGAAAGTGTALVVAPIVARRYLKAKYAATPKEDISGTVVRAGYTLGDLSEESTLQERVFSGQKPRFVNPTGFLSKKQ